MNVEIVNCPENLEDLIIKDSKFFYELNITKNDVERFIRKSIRDDYTLILSRYNVTFKINCTISCYNELKSLNFNVPRSTKLKTNLSFILPNEIKNNEKIELTIATYLKKIDLCLKELNIDKLNDLVFYPQICTLNYLQSENLFDWYYLVTMKDCISVSVEFKNLAKTIFEKLSEKYPFIFNDITFKLFTRVHRCIDV